MIMFKREVGEAALDFTLVCVAYLAAFVLHYGFPNPAAPGPDPYAAIPAMLSASLALALLIKMSLLLVFQAYRGMWRYLGIADLMTLTKVYTLLASAVLIVGFPRSWCRRRESSRGRCWSSTFWCSRSCSSGRGCSSPG